MNTEKENAAPLTPEEKKEYELRVLMDLTAVTYNLLKEGRFEGKYAQSVIRAQNWLLAMNQALKEQLEPKEPNVVPEVPGSEGAR
jgi:hypothetical protein